MLQIEACHNSFKMHILQERKNVNIIFHQSYNVLPAAVKWCIDYASLFIYCQENVAMKSYVRRR